MTVTLKASWRFVFQISNAPFGYFIAIWLDVTFDGNKFSRLCDVRCQFPPIYCYKEINRFVNGRLTVHLSLRKTVEIKCWVFFCQCNYLVLDLSIYLLFLSNGEDIFSGLLRVSLKVYEPFESSTNPSWNPETVWLQRLQSESFSIEVRNFWKNYV